MISRGHGRMPWVCYLVVAAGTECSKKENTTTMMSKKQDDATSYASFVQKI